MDFNLQDVAKPGMTIFGEEGVAGGGVRGGYNVSCQAVSPPTDCIVLYVRHVNQVHTLQLERINI